MFPCRSSVVPQAAYVSSEARFQHQKLAHCKLCSLFNVFHSGCVLLLRSHHVLVHTLRVLLQQQRISVYYLDTNLARAANNMH